MRVLVFNVGSSSLKLSVTDAPDGAQEFKSELPLPDGDIGAVMPRLAQLLREGAIAEVEAVGHRVVHGGERFRDAIRLDDEVLRDIESLNALAPLHNPPAVATIRAARIAWPGIPQVAVFDTAFHLGMPPHAASYAVPREWRESGVRRFGFHGTSHKYVVERVAAELGPSFSGMRLISCHLGNGASVCAIRDGVSIDTSMGMTPLEGLVMGTRSGDVDPGLVGHLTRTLGLDVAAIERALYHRSGLAALSGLGNDLRAIEAAAAGGDADAQLAIAVYAYRVRKYLGAYAAAMGGLDVIAFTGGIGENSALMRSRACEGLEFMGVRLDTQANAGLNLEGYELGSIHRRDSTVRVVVTQTREQWMIARETFRVLAKA